MGVPKGTDNFNAYRAARQEGALELLRTELEKARRRKMPYPSKATLVSDMAERTKIHRTTLIRNPLYHRMLLEFLGGQAGGSTFILDKDASPEMLRAKLIDAQMEIGRLKLALETAIRNDATNAMQTRVTLPQPVESVAHAAFVDTVGALRALLDWVNADGLLFDVDLEKGEIRDLAAAPGRQIVVAGPRLRPFIEALRTLLEQER
jgi:hypothetical protein